MVKIEFCDGFNISRINRLLHKKYYCLGGIITWFDWNISSFLIIGIVWEDIYLKYDKTLGFLIVVDFNWIGQLTDSSILNSKWFFVIIVIDSNKYICINISIYNFTIYILSTLKYSTTQNTYAKELRLNSINLSFSDNGIKFGKKNVIHLSNKISKFNYNSILTQKLRNHNNAL